jgi:hypothetical protein
MRSCSTLWIYYPFALCLMDGSQVGITGLLKASHPTTQSRGSDNPKVSRSLIVYHLFQGCFVLMGATMAFAFES